MLKPFITYQTVHWGETILIIGYDLKNKVFFAIDQLEKERLNYQVYFGGVDKNIYAFEKSTLLAATIFSRPQRKFTLYTRFKNILFRYLLIISLLYGIKTKAQYYQKPEILDRTLSEKPLIPCNKTQFRPTICHFRS